MDIKREKQLRKDAFPTMARHHKLITGGAGLRLSDIMRILKVSRPTARKFASELCETKKAVCYCDSPYEPIEITMKFGGYTDKELERSQRAYEDLIWEITQ